MSKDSNVNRHLELLDPDDGIPIAPPARLLAAYLEYVIAEVAVIDTDIADLVREAANRLNRIESRVPH